MKKEEKKSNKPAPKAAIAPQERKALWQRKYFFEALIFLFSFLLFANTIPNSYCLDDELVTIDHHLTSQGISAIPEIFSSPYYQDQSGYSYEYRPVVHVSFAIEHQFFGDNPHVSHFWNVILYALCCMLLYRSLLLLFQGFSPLLSFAITLLFAAHPAHTEVVASIKNRDEILGLLFSFLAFYSALKVFRIKSTTKGFSALFENKLWLWLLLIPVSFVLALWSKITVLSFAVIIPMALVLFAEFDLVRMLYVVLALIIPVVTVANLGNTVTKFALVLASMSVVAVVYIVKNFSNIKTIVQKGVRSIFDRNQYSPFDQENADTSLSSFFTLTLPPFSVVNYSINILLLGAVLFGMFYHLYIIQVIAALTLVVLLFSKNESQKAPATLSLFFILVYRSYYLHLFQYTGFEEVLTLIIAYYLVYGRRWMLIPAIITLSVVGVIFVAAGSAPVGTILPILLVIITLFLQRFRYGWTILILLAVNVIPTGFSLAAFDVRYLLVFLLTAVLSLTVYFKSRSSLVAKIYLILALAFTMFDHPELNGDKVFIGKTRTAVSSISPRVISKNENRPIDYSENCIDFVKTPKSIKIGTSFEILSHYLRKVVLSYPLSYYYGYSFITPMSISDTLPLFSLIIHLLLFLVALFFWRRDPRICFGLLLYLISITVFSNYVQPVPGMLADRFLLIPSLGWIIVFVVTLQKLSKTHLSSDIISVRTVSPLVKGIFSASLLLYSALTFSRNMDWKDYMTLFKHDIRYVDGSAQAHNLLAHRLMKESYDHPAADQQDMRQEAVGHFTRAVAIYPAFFNATYDAARAYVVLNKPDSAVIFLEKASKIKPDFTQIYTSEGEILFRQGKLDQAREQFQKIITAIPDQYLGYDKVSYSYYLQKNYPKALEINKLAVSRLPHDASPCVSLARIYQAMERNDSARYWLGRALEINPSDPQAKNLQQTLPPK